METFYYDLGNGLVALVPFPADLPLAERDAYMANPPADAIANARRMPKTVFDPPTVDDAAPAAVVAAAPDAPAIPTPDADDAPADSSELED